MIKITHNNRCSKSRSSLSILQESGKEFEVVEYLNGSLDREILDEILTKLGLSGEDVVRKGENIFKEKFMGSTQDFQEEDWRRIILENPALLERPIIWDEEKAVIGRPPENVDIFLLKK